MGSQMIIFGIGEVCVKGILCLLCFFIIVMDVLGSLFRHAESRGLLHSLEAANVRSRLSMYADDVVLFVKPLDDDLVCTKLILDCFGEASGLVANMNKSCAIPICCVAPVVQDSCSTLQCERCLPMHLFGLADLQQEATKK
jgi:hypothetical protein